MGNLDFSANADQLKELATYMASQINVPTIGIGGGYAPIGSINFFDATTAPQDWLACDGTVYNIADYPQLADWYEAQHGSKNFYGGDGTTTFAVPDLQGEFLRGTGTNSHANQGSGASVGEHQDGTLQASIGGNGHSAVITSRIRVLPESNTDWKSSVQGTVYADVNTSREDDARGFEFTSRPTNTSFLICVKAVVAGEVYSTEERVVGTWIDGKPIYQKTIVSTSPTAINTWQKIVDIGSTCNIHNVWGYLTTSAGEKNPLGFNSSSTINVFTIHQGGVLGTVSANVSTQDYANRPLICVIQYTKTTD